MNSEACCDALLANPAATLRALDCADARDSLADFCGLIEIPGAPIEDDDDIEGEPYRPIRRPLAAHHKLLIEALERVETGEVRRLMVFMPPGSAKSSYASVVFPVWFMGRQKRRNVIVATYASDLARKIGRRARSILKQPVYREIFDAGLSADSSAADEWALTNENEFMGGGILSGITGNRADLIIVDDPIRGRQQADSETTRKTTRAAYDDDLKTRLKPGGRIVIIQTRWHMADLAGSLLPENYDGENGVVTGRDGEKWFVINIPAEATSVDDPLGRKPGEMLWPEWFDADHWRAFRSNARTWSALYQQRPQPEEGTYFQRDWFRFWTPETRPKALRIYGTSDYAVTEGGGDFTVHRVWGVDHQGDIYRLDGWRGQTSSDRWIDEKINLIQRWKPSAWFGEAGVIQKSIEPALVRRMRERKIMCRLEWVSSISDKPSRARGFQARAAMKTVWFEPNADLSEFLHFPAGKHDDDVDTASLIGRVLDEAHPAVLRNTPAPNKPTDGYSRSRDSEESWRTA